jgi:hypothetical protein
MVQRRIDDSVAWLVGIRKAILQGEVSNQVGWPDGRPACRSGKVGVNPIRRRLCDGNLSYVLAPLHTCHGVSDLSSRCFALFELDRACHIDIQSLVDLVHT